MTPAGMEANAPQPFCVQGNVFETGGDLSSTPVTYTILTR